jgi:DNA-binding transcriptional ArsR family regulator
VTGDADISVPARALGDPARGRIVTALLGGRAIPAGELARAAGVSASTASEHLRVLLDAGIVAVDRVGRNRFFRLTDDEVARAVEALQAIAPRTVVHSFRQHRVSAELREARTCYDHLAGDLGLRVTDLLVDARILASIRTAASESAPEPFPAGPVVESLGLHPGSGQRPWSRGCLDWTGRRPHVAGQLGAQILQAMEVQQWITRRPDSRAVRLTETGAREFSALEGTVSVLANGRS